MLAYMTHPAGPFANAGPIPVWGWAVIGLFIAALVAYTFVNARASILQRLGRRYQERPTEGKPTRAEPKAA